jgi:DNA-repair protein XRCC2
MQCGIKRVDDYVMKHSSAGGLWGGDVVELYGKSNSGKTSALLSAALHCILPRSVGGMESRAILFDNDYKFDVRKLEQMSCTRLTSSQGASLRVHDALNVFKESAKRLYVFRCFDSREMVETLGRGLPDLLASLEFDSAPVRLVLIDTIAAHFWLDRYEETLLQKHSISARSSSSSSSVPRSQLMPQMLGKIIEQYGLVALAAKPSFFQSNKEAFAHREYLPSAWRSLVKYRLVLGANVS